MAVKILQCSTFNAIQLILEARDYCNTQELEHIDIYLANNVQIYINNRKILSK